MNRKLETDSTLSRELLKLRLHCYAFAGLALLAFGVLLAGALYAGKANHDQWQARAKAVCEIDPGNCICGQHTEAK